MQNLTQHNCRVQKFDVYQVVWVEAHRKAAWGGLENMESNTTGVHKDKASFVGCKNTNRPYSNNTNGETTMVGQLFNLGLLNRTGFCLLLAAEEKALVFAVTLFSKNHCLFV